MHYSAPKPIKMKILFLLSILCLTLASCEGEKATYRATQAFNLNNLALKDGETVKLLYMGSKLNKLESNCYLQLIVISQESGDTVNILTNQNLHITKSDGDKVFNFFDENNLINRVEQLKEETTAQDLDKLKPAKRHDKVAIDPKFHNFSYNNWPTVIGSIGTFTKTK